MKRSALTPLRVRVWRKMMSNFFPGNVMDP